MQKIFQIRHNFSAKSVKYIDTITAEIGSKPYRYLRIAGKAALFLKV